MNGVNGYRFRYKTNTERYKGERKNPKFFDPYYDYSGIIGDETRPVLPFKQVKDVDRRIRDNKLPDYIENLSGTKQKEKFNSSEPLPYYIEV